MRHQVCRPPRVMGAPRRPPRWPAPPLPRQSDHLATGDRKTWGRHGAPRGLSLSRSESCALKFNKAAPPGAGRVLQSRGWGPASFGSNSRTPHSPQPSSAPPRPRAPRAPRAPVAPRTPRARPGRDLRPRRTTHASPGGPRARPLSAPFPSAFPWTPRAPRSPAVEAHARGHPSLTCPVSPFQLPS